MFSRLRALLANGLRVLKNAFRLFTAAFRAKQTTKKDTTLHDQSAKPTASEDATNSANSARQAEKTPRLLLDAARDPVIKNYEGPTENIETKAAPVEEKKTTKLPNSTYAAPANADQLKRRSVAALITKFDKNDSKSAADEDAMIADLPQLTMKTSPAGLLSSGISKKFASNFLVRFLSNLSSSSEVSDKATDKPERA